MIVISSSIEDRRRGGESGNELGVSLAIVNTGGGSEVMHGRLESGHWLVVGGADDFLSDIRDRIESDAEGRPLGWSAGIYANDSSEGLPAQRAMQRCGCVAYVQHDETRLLELNDVIREVLGRFGSWGTQAPQHSSRD